MDKNKIIGTVVVIILSIAGAFGLVNVDSIKSEICPAPSAEVAK